MSDTIELISRSVEDTLRIGRAIGAVLCAGDVVALVGELGSGKTHLVKGIALGLGVPDDKLVNSPTFVLVNEYLGRLPIYHVDAYRLSDASQLAAIGFDELCQSQAVVLVELADRVAEAIGPHALWIELGVSGPQSRAMRLRAESQAVAGRLGAAGLDRPSAAYDKSSP